ncbi:uncharacterized protein (UPF0261 family) [Friedmanniella endophytica]|uniref:Uncharacterized protein (UPF0261 family) n=1 Tax=Microlunatus kandeliicorticis TaxID=1759536 RepID=A0A7W3IPY6_9ACTN|nr:Tm-1-like ATP-binding domain-containing protein [Microlunatus kandeliicorticis]MBA8793025.1 uncharacterized protein (UPF0261 family) [Microlunatus kandeliicorticis]
MTGTDPGRPTVALVGALDTKAEEYRFVRDRLRASELATLVVDVGVLGSPRLEADLSRDRVAAAGGVALDGLVDRHDRNAAMEAMATGAARLVAERQVAGEVSAVVVLGGSNAGFVMSRIAPALPFGVPKVLVSTMVAGDTRPYVGTSDLIMFAPVVDLAGLNSVSAPVLARAADAVAGMLAGAPVPPPPAGARIAATMVGLTTPLVTAVQQHVVAGGGELHVFHCTGTGGRAMEAMIGDGVFDAVADLTPTELVDAELGGICTAGPDRMTAAGRRGLPQLVSAGALDMINFGPRDTVPARFAGRRLHQHNPVITLVRTSPEENARIGAVIATRLNASTGPVEVLVPARGFSAIAVRGEPFHDPDADRALIAALERDLAPRIPLHVLDLAVNDPEFAAEAIATLDRLTGRTHVPPSRPTALSER